MVASEGIWMPGEHKRSARALLAEHRVVRIPAAIAPAQAAAWGEAVLAARAQWTEDFDGDQYALGRAYYTHLETGQARRYFKEAARADAVVEQVLPGMQAALRALYSDLVGAPVLPRAGWCGPGVHVFLDEGPVARRGGVVHFDTEGLSEEHLATGAEALSLVVMLRPPTDGGGLTVWDVTYRGEDAPSAEELLAPAWTARYARGDALLFASRTLHQIERFDGGPRLSITAHAVLADGGWRCWF